MKRATEDLSKLPRWAQDRIGILEVNLRAAPRATRAERGGIEMECESLIYRNPGNPRDQGIRCSSPASHYNDKPRDDGSPEPRRWYWCDRHKMRDSVMLAALEIKAPELATALGRVLALFRLPDEDSLDHFERVAAWYYRETGHLRPGKDEPAFGGSTDTQEERQKRYTRWHEGIIAEARKVLAKVTGEKP